VYFEASSVKGFFPVVEIQFTIEDGAQHYHVPLLLSPYGYSTYRGS
jgi:5-hydroxyisourate hydrolase